MLKIPFKRPESLSFEKPLSKAIVQIFEEDPEQYREDFDALQQLRTGIMNPQDHEASASSHLSYYAQLHYLESKFMFSESDVNVVFSWSNAFDVSDSVSSHNIGFEKASVIFNVGAIYNHLGVNAGLQDDESMKRGATYFQQSAGAFQSIVDNLTNWNIIGSPNAQLSALANLMLGQAQEVFFKKAVAGKMKPGNLAKLAMQVSTFHTAAYDIAITTETFNKAWHSHMQAKAFYYAGVAAYYKGLEQESNGKYGEQVGWLASALESLKSATDKSLIRYLPVETLEPEIKSFMAMCTAAHQSANKDNDKIYMETVPKIADLAPIAPVRMVNPIPIPEMKDFDKYAKKPFFRNLVPIRVHLALSKYSSKRENLVNSIIATLNDSTQLAMTTLTSLHLPGSIEALEQPIGLPAQVIQRSEEVRSKGGPRNITNSWATLEHFASKDRQLLKEAIDALDAEEKEDDEQRMVHGSRWTRTPSKMLTIKLREQAQEFSVKIKAADSANQIVEKKVSQNLYLIELLCMDRRALEASVPASTASSTLALKDPNLIELKKQLNLLNANLKERNELIKRIRVTASKDDIGPLLTKNALSNQQKDDEALFEEQFQIYDNDRQLAKKLVADQAKLLETIVEYNRTFMESRQTNDMIRERETALSNLDAGYRHFNDLTKNLEEGIKFFSDLEQLLVKFNNQCQDYVKARRLQVQEGILTADLANMNLSRAPQPGVWNPPTQQSLYGNVQPNYSYGQPSWNQNSNPYQSVGSYPPTQQPLAYSNQNPAVPGQYPSQPMNPYPGQYPQPGAYTPPLYYDQTQKPP